MYIDFSEWAEKVKIFVYLVKAQQRMTSAEEDFNNSVDTRQPLSSAAPVITQWACEQSGHGGRDGGYAWVQQHGLPFTKANLTTATAESPLWHHS